MSQKSVNQNEKESNNRNANIGTENSQMIEDSQTEIDERDLSSKNASKNSNKVNQQNKTVETEDSHSDDYVSIIDPSASTHSSDGDNLSVATVIEKSSLLQLDFTIILLNLDKP